jgi:hypothetical protein
MFYVMHPFHPLRGREIELVSCVRGWTGERVYFLDAEQRLTSVPTAWTSLAAADPFVEMARGRAHFRVEDLLRLSEMIQDLKSVEIVPGKKCVRGGV